MYSINTQLLKSVNYLQNFIILFAILWEYSYYCLF